MTSSRRIKSRVSCRRFYDEYGQNLIDTFEKAVADKARASAEPGYGK